MFTHIVINAFLPVFLSLYSRMFIMVVDLTDKPNKTFVSDLESLPRCKPKYYVCHNGRFRNDDGIGAILSQYMTLDVLLFITVIALAVIN